MKDKINSRKKGAKAERKVVALLKDWTGREFARTPASGGLRWKTANVIGDVVCTEERHFFPFAVEVKFYRDINFEHLFYLDDPKIYRFWKQATEDARRGHKLPLLFMRYNGMPSDFWIIVMTLREFKKLKPYLQLNFPYAVFRGVKQFAIMSSHCLLEAQYKTINKRAVKIIDKKWPEKD